MSEEINQFNHVGLMARYKHAFNNAFWDKIMVENVAGLDRDTVLKTIMKSCKPYDFIPVQYVFSKNTASFLLKDCGSAIRKLCSQDLIVKNPYNHDKPFKISIKPCYSRSNDLKINIQLNIQNVLKKRYSSETGTLNLENFAKDTELEEYCTLSQPKLFYYVMHIAKNIPFKILKLSNNYIDSLSSMEALDSSTDPIVLDLKNNCIYDVSQLNYLKHLNVIELWLDGNPICNNYSEITYGKSIKQHVKLLEKLDGINIKSEEFPPFRRNFLCDVTGYDLVDQFLEHYFTLYDSQNRSLLKDIYHRDALFSLTSMYIPLQSTSSTTKLITYKNVARNLKQMIDLSKNTQNLFLGPYLITKALTSLPDTEHDAYSFTADLMMQTEKMAVLVVSGVFREYGVTVLGPDRLLGFTRTFVLLAKENGEYSIINEMLNVTNATTTQASRAFKLTKVKVPELQCTDLPRPQDIKEVQDTIEALKAITGLKTIWARRCLEERDYDLAKAVEVCIQLFKLNKIPKFAIDSEQKKREAKKNKRRMANTSVARKKLKTEPISAANTKQINQKTAEVLPKSKVENKIQLRLTTPAVGIARPINRQSPPALLQSKQLQIPGREKISEPVVDFIDLTESSKEPSIPPLLGEKKPSIPPLLGEKKPSKSSADEKKDSQMEEKFQATSFKSEFKHIQDIYTKKDHSEALQMVEKLILKNRIHYPAFEMVFLWLYKTNMDEAREMKKKVMDTANYVKPFLSGWQLELLFAICECMHGNFHVGEAEFRKMIKARQKWARPITEFCRVLLKKKETGKARAFLKPYVTGRSGEKLQKKLITIAGELCREFKVKLLQD